VSQAGHGADADRWDRRYAAQDPVPLEAVGPPAALAPHAALLPTRGLALELACGPGRTAVWLARRGLVVHGVDVSPVAGGLARDLAERAGVADRCTVEVADLHDGLPSGPPVDLVLCHRFWAPHLAEPVMQRVRPGGVVALAVLSEVGAAPGRFRATPGELRRAHRGLEVLVDEEGDGLAVLVGRRPS
jgi:SAM-dependent methyltransferase